VPSSASAEWIPIGTSVDNSVWQMDATRIRTVGSKQQAWVKVDHSRDRTVPWRESLRLFSFDCTAQTYKMLSYVNRDSYGKTVGSRSFSDYGSSIGYEPLVPDSMAESVSEIACYSPHATTGD
jgi:hypothetical protein